MLSPDQLERAGDTIAAIYNDMEAKMLDHLVDSLLSLDSLDQKSITELNLLAQSMAPKLKRIIEDSRNAIADEVYETCERFLKTSDTDDIRRTGGGEPIWPQQLAATVTGAQLILDRDNLQMESGARKAFLNASIEAVTRVNAGVMTTERALHSAVRKLEREGIPIITYQNRATGTVTVENKVDVAVRRHIRTQIAQDGARMTLERMEDMGISLVEVSSHDDSRPEHALWQGRVYSLKGGVTIDGVRYPDFYEATGYGSVDGLMGANCRHSFGPYRHGAKRAYSPNPKHPSGLPGKEIYELEQKQRYLERQIRTAKRELRGAQQVYEKAKNLESRTTLLKAQDKLKQRQAAMRELIHDANTKAKPGTTVLTRRPNREWAGDMPKGARVNSSQRSLNEFVRSKADQLKAAGISQARFKAEISGELAKMDASSKDFASLSRSRQKAMGDGVIARLKKAVDSKLPSTKKANAGKHIDRIAGVARGNPMSFERANGGKVNPDFSKSIKNEMNCQSSVVVFEMRLRGYDVEVMPYSEHSIMKELAREPEVAWRDPKTGEIPKPQTLTGVNTPQRLLKYLEENTKEGERYTFRYDVRGSGWGHVVSLEKTTEGMRIYDPQNGKIYTGREYRDFIRTRVEYKTKSYGITIEHPVDLLRIDNLEFNTNVVNQIAKEAR